MKHIFHPTAALRHAREMAGMSVAQAADAVGYKSPATWYRAEQNCGPERAASLVSMLHPTWEVRELGDDVSGSCSDGLPSQVRGTRMIEIEDDINVTEIVSELVWAESHRYLMVSRAGLLDAISTDAAGKCIVSHLRHDLWLVITKDR